MPGENLQKLSKEELRVLRKIVRRVYAVEEGFSLARAEAFFTDRECDKLIDSLLPGTVEKLREMGESRGFLNDKKFFLPTKLVGLNGDSMMKEDKPK
jgi:hypothetical protein